MDPFRDLMMRESLRQARELRDLMDNPAIKSALEFQRQYGHLFAQWERMMSSPTFQFLREHQERHNRHLNELISSPAFNAAREFLRQNDAVHRSLDSSAWKMVRDAEKRQRELSAITNLTASRAFSEVTRFIENNINFGFSPNFFAAEILNTLSAIEEPTDEQSFQDFIAGLENLLTLIIEKCKELAVNPTTYWAMVKFAFTIFMFLYPLYEGQKTEKRVIDSVNQTQTRILEEIDKIKPTEVNEVYYVVEREAKLKSQPRPKSPTIQILSRNQRLRLIKRKGKWIYVEYFDYVEGVPKTGWVLKKYTKRVELSELSRGSARLKSTIEVSETALLSEQALAEDWNRPEEDEAWSHLQSVP